MTATSAIAVIWTLAVLASLPLVFVGAMQWKRKVPKPPITFMEPSIDLDALGLMI